MTERQRGLITDYEHGGRVRQEVIAVRDYSPVGETEAREEKPTTFGKALTESVYYK